jgi:hypothetical protein
MADGGLLMPRGATAATASFLLAHDLFRPLFAREAGFAKAENRFPLFAIMRYSPIRRKI